MLQYAITDRNPNPQPGTDPFAGLVEQAARLSVDRVDFLQIREKHLEAKQLIGLTRRIITAIRKASPTGGPRLRVLVNGRPDVALAAGADGVHLPSDPEQLTVPQVRQIFAHRQADPEAQSNPEAQPIVSVACHTLAEVERASGEGADLILFSPVFGKKIEEGDDLAGVGLDLLATACRVAGATPVLALGGVTRSNAQACILAGARGVAGIRLFQ